LIGICDQEYAMKNSMNMYFTNSPFAGYESNDIFSDIAAPRHGDMVADIIAGQYKNSNGEIEYKGIVPSAKLYLANAGENQQIFKYKTSFEYLASQGCSVINMSRYVGEDPKSTYGDTAKWIDSFIQRYNINVIMSAGNITTGGTGVTSGKMSYNSIVVGSCDKDGLIASDSCYSSSNTKAYKPDLTAYGVNVNIPTRPFGVSGTSCAAPMVTGLVAQMCQLSATLRANPTLMKAVIVNSTKRSASMQSNNCMSLPNTVSYPLEHKYGVGIMFAPYAYVMVHDNSYFGYGTLSSTETSTTFSKQITKATNKLVRIVATVKNDYPELPLETIRLQVTDPNGNTYTSQYQYDNKQVVVIKPGISGVYQINLVRLNGTNYNLSYAISYNVIAE
ncbi:MAG: S8 family peptidase, partial [Ruminococcus sp.]